MREGEVLVEELERMGFRIAEETRDRLLWFLKELLRWNRRLNLTAITDPAEGIEKHLLDSLTLVPLLRGQENILDIGSGGGFPGIPLKIVLPKLHILSVDAVRKKIDFQRHIVRRLGLHGFEAWHGRAEQLPERREWVRAFDLVVSRAFSSLPEFARLALPCLAPQGRIVAMKGSEGATELDRARAELETLGLVCTEVRKLHLPLSLAERSLIVLSRRADRP